MDLRQYEKDMQEMQRLMAVYEKRIAMGKIPDDCQYFIQEYVKIEDRDSAELAVPFVLWDKQREVLKQFQEFRLNIILKARQLGLSWLAIAFSAWNIVTKAGYQVVALSRTEEEAKELVRRLKFILDNLPEWMITEKDKDNKRDGLKWDSKTLEVTVYHKHPSVFKSFPASQDSGRSFTANLVILDEWAFQQWANEIWSAAYPVVNRPTGGAVIGLSTAKRLTLFEDIWIKATKGLNTFNRIFLPWWTDPRRTQEWYEQTKKDLPNSYKAEYPATPEEAFEAAEGVAFGEFSYDIHVCEPFEIPSFWQKWMAVDNGYNDPFAWYWFAVDGDGVVYVYREYTRNPKKEDKVAYSDQARKVVNLTGDEKIAYTVAGHDAWNIHHMSINATSPQGKSIIDYYNDGGVRNCIKCTPDRILRKATWHEYLKPYFDKNTEKTTARLKIFSTCTQLIDTIPKLLNDEKNIEKVAECKFDHWYDACLSATTLIDTTNGKVRIDELVGKIGYVYCYDENLKVPAISSYHDVRMTRENVEIFEIETEDGRKIQATYDHEVLTDKGWKQVKDLTDDDYIVDIGDHL